VGPVTAESSVLVQNPRVEKSKVAPRARIDFDRYFRRGLVEVQ
jgi:hypothetical protein